MNEKRWNLVRQFYMDSFGISPELVDLMASNDILLMSVSGSANKSISTILNIDEDAIKEILSTILSFDGWTKDLEFNPLKIYEQDHSYLAFVGSIAELAIPGITISDIILMYSMCTLYSEIESKLETDWI